MKSLVVVGNGFIGNYLLWNLGYTASFVIGRDHEGDICQLPSNQVYDVVWAHGESRGDKIEESQFTTLKNCLALFEKLGVVTDRHIFISSQKVYEDPISTFGKVKLQCESLLSWSVENSVSVRVPNVYGSFSETKQNSILSSWLLDAENIKANLSVRQYISTAQLCDKIKYLLAQDTCGVIDLLTESERISNIGLEVSKIRKIPCEIDHTSDNFGTLEIPKTNKDFVYENNILKQLEFYHKSSQFSQSLKSRVEVNSRFHKRENSSLYLQDFGIFCFDTFDLERVYIFNIDNGVKRGGHYHKEQTETFYIVEGRCEIQLENEQGFKGTVSLSQGEYITVKPYEQHTFWARSKSCIILTFSNFGYIPNSVPDTYVYPR